MARVLILGGTRNLGHVTAVALLEAGHRVTVLNRGITRDELPPSVERLHAAREDRFALLHVSRDRTWDVIVDTTSYTGADATGVCETFGDRCARMIFISTGQVYLVRRNLRRPFHESDYEGPLIPAPPVGTDDHAGWLYGVSKRDAEDVYAKAAKKDFPVVTLRLPMVASERDHYARLQGYIARAQDGGPILVPDDGSLPVRHVYVEDVARMIEILCTDSREGVAQYNVSFGESISLQHFFDLLAAELGTEVKTVPAKRDILEARALLPACSPYSVRWMSELDSSASLGALAGSSFSYTPPAQYVRRIVADYEKRWKRSRLLIPGYDRRAEEAEIAKNHG